MNANEKVQKTLKSNRTCLKCDECCNYRVVVTQVGISTIGITTISNSSLAAIIVDRACKY